MELSIAHASRETLFWLKKEKEILGHINEKVHNRLCTKESFEKGSCWNDVLECKESYVKALLGGWRLGDRYNSNFRNKEGCFSPYIMALAELSEMYPDLINLDDKYIKSTANDVNYYRRVYSIDIDED